MASSFFSINNMGVSSQIEGQTTHSCSANMFHVGLASHFSTTYLCSLGLWTVSRPGKIRTLGRRTSEPLRITGLWGCDSPSILGRTATGHFGAIGCRVQLVQFINPPKTWFEWVWRVFWNHEFAPKWPNIVTQEPFFRLKFPSNHFWNMCTSNKSTMMHETWPRVQDYQFHGRCDELDGHFHLRFRSLKLATLEYLTNIYIGTQTVRWLVSNKSLTLWIFSFFLILANFNFLHLLIGDLIIFWNINRFFKKI